jgi:ankyrin repeat protein
MYGRLLKPEKIRKEIKRNRLRQSALNRTGPLGSLPGHLEIRTPPLLSHPMPLQLRAASVISDAAVRSTTGAIFQTQDFELGRTEDMHQLLLAFPPAAETVGAVHTLLPGETLPGSDLGITQPIKYVPHNSSQVAYDSSLTSLPHMEGSSYTASSTMLSGLVKWLQSITLSDSPHTLLSPPLIKTLEDALETSTRSLYHAGTQKELAKHPLHIKSIFYTIHSLINAHCSLDDMAKSTDPHSFAKSTDPHSTIIIATVQQLDRVPQLVLLGLLHTVPEMHVMPLKRGLFGVAIVVGASRIVDALLSQNPEQAQTFMSIRLNYHIRCLSPLEYACKLHHLEIVRLLLQFGFDPNNYETTPPLSYILQVNKGKSTTFSDQAIEICAMMFQRKARLHSGWDGGVLCPEYCSDSRLNPWLLQYIEGTDYIFHVYFECGMLAAILQTDDKQLALTTLRSVLNHTWTAETKAHRLWELTLSAGLCNVAFQYHHETVDLLVTAGAHADTRCLINAVRGRSVEAVERFLSMGIDANGFGCEPLYHPNFGGVRLHLDNRTAVSQAISMGFQEALDIFEERGFIANIRTEFFSVTVALTAAIKATNETLIEKLLQPYHTGIFQVSDHCDGIQKSRLDLRKIENPTAVAVRVGRIDLLPKLLAAGFGPCSDTLVQSLYSGNIELAIKLLDFSIPVKNWDFQSQFQGNVRVRLLEEAICVGSMPLVEALIDTYSYPWEDDNIPYGLEFGSTEKSFYLQPLSLAIIEGRHEIAQFLLLKNPESNQPRVKDNWKLFTPLAATMRTRNYGLFQHLLDEGANPFDDTALTQAVVDCNVQGAHKLLDACQKHLSRPKKRFGPWALIEAVKLGDLEMVRILAGWVDVNCLEPKVPNSRNGWYNYEHTTPLGAAMLYSELNQTDGLYMTRMLLENGGNPNGLVLAPDTEETEGFFGTFALTCAIESGSLPMVKLLVNHGADVSLLAKGGMSRTPLQCATENGREDIIHFLLEQGADPNEPIAPRGGVTALQIAAIKGWIGTATILIKAGANVNAERALIDGRTAFEGATEHGRLDMMMYLVENHADILSDDGRQYKRAIRFAQQNGQISAERLAEKLYKEAIENAAIWASVTGVVGEPTNQDVNVDFDDWIASPPVIS